MVQKIVLLILFFTAGTAGIASKRISGCSATCMTLPSDDTLKKVDSIFSAKIVQIFEKKPRHRKISDPCVCGAGVGIDVGIVKIKNILYDKGNLLQRHQSQARLFHLSGVKRFSILTTAFAGLRLPSLMAQERYRDDFAQE